jgi:hypothetical protein
LKTESLRPSCEKKLETELTELKSKIVESLNLKETDIARVNLLDLGRRLVAKTLL